MPDEYRQGLQQHQTNNKTDEQLIQLFNNLFIYLFIYLSNTDSFFYNELL